MGGTCGLEWDGEHEQEASKMPGRMIKTKSNASLKPPVSFFCVSLVCAFCSLLEDTGTVTSVSYVAVVPIATASFFISCKLKVYEAFLRRGWHIMASKKRRGAPIDSPPVDFTPCRPHFLLKGFSMLATFCFFWYRLLPIQKPGSILFQPLQNGAHL